ncbi:MAG: class I SAM-dependent methyltransferase [Sulfuricurvum sp.]|nr:class I SAM-dependent methyltransferase [Sulfuricurvum sp.]
MYENKEITYFSYIREDLINLIPKTFRACNVLEIGCGNGATLQKLKKIGIANKTTGIELFPSEDNFYDTVDHFFPENVEQMAFPSYMNNSFDIILLGDVLEHLVDPWSTLKKVSTLLKAEGRIIVSLPNIRYYTILKSIIFNGDFKYEEAGILDKTHLRFFCRKNIIELLENADLKVDIITSTFDRETIKSKKHLLNKITFGLFHDFFVYQFLAVARKVQV